MRRSIKGTKERGREGGRQARQVGVASGRERFQDALLSEGGISSLLWKFYCCQGSTTIQKEKKSLAAWEHGQQGKMKALALGRGKVQKKKPPDSSATRNGGLASEFEAPQQRV